MKKLLTVLAATVLTINSFGQITITKSVDDMTDKVSSLASERFVCANEPQTEGFAIDMIIKDKSGIKSSTFFILTMVGLESCNEDNTLIILFDNEEKIVLKSWNKFNCKGNAYFTFSKSNIEMLKNTPIAKVRITNGRSYKHYTSESINKNYFIEFYNALIN